LCEKPPRKATDTAVQTAAEWQLPLIQAGAATTKPLSVLVLFGPSAASPLPLIQSLARQKSIGTLEIVVLRPEAKDHSSIEAALEALFPAHSLVEQPAAMGKLEQIVSARELLTHEQVFIVDEATVLPDSLTLATLSVMLSINSVETVGCLIRSADEKRVPLCAGYAPSGISLYGTPALSFEPIDPASLRQPMTYPVIANSSNALLVKASLLRDMVSHGSTAARPEVDDLLLGIQAIERGGLNLCTTLVSAYSGTPAVHRMQLGVSLPYRLSIETLSQLVQSSLIVQAIR
jgi:hypothetical protein